MATVQEIADGVFRIATYVPPINLQFAQFLVRDDEPVLFHTGLRGMFPDVRDAVATVIDPTTVRWIGFSHLEADECGSLGAWLESAPGAQAVCSLVGALVSINDMTQREARGMSTGDVLETGEHRLRFIATPHVPHGWDAGVMFDETTQTLLCSDLFHQNGDVEPTTEGDVVERTRAMYREYEAGPLARYMPYTDYTSQALAELAALAPTTVATMHGSTFVGDGAAALRDLDAVMQEALRPPGRPDA
jgi:flavorubredoxin